MTVERTRIYQTDEHGEQLLGYLSTDGTLYRPGPDGALIVGRIATPQVFRKTAYDERELGYFTTSGRIHSHGLFEGGELGWVEPDGVVVQAGLILGEEEVGRVEGPQPLPAAAALLLLYLPDAQEAAKRSQR